MNKKTKKKEKRITFLSKTTQQSFLEREKIISKRKEMENKKKTEESKIEEEKKEKTVEELTKDLQAM